MRTGSAGRSSSWAVSAMTFTASCIRSRGSRSQPAGSMKRDGLASTFPQSFPWTSVTPTNTDTLPTSPVRGSCVVNLRPRVHDSLAVPFCLTDSIGHASGSSSISDTGKDTDSLSQPNRAAPRAVRLTASSDVTVPDRVRSVFRTTSPSVRKGKWSRPPWTTLLLHRVTPPHGVLPPRSCWRRTGPSRSVAALTGLPGTPTLAQPGAPLREAHSACLTPTSTALRAG